YDAASTTCSNACHFGSSPKWTQPGPLACSGCHSSPPAAPHPQVSTCTLCHATDRGQHVDGIVEVAVPATCDGCHGSATNPAPPRSLDGGPDIGAHQAHVV